MEREANYITVGAFVLLVIAMATVLVLWYTGSRDKRHYQRYEIYFRGSVSGLNVGGFVRYLGVDVGRVRVLRVDPRAADRVQVIADIDTKAPISAETIATLGLQGVTGLLYIDLQRDQGEKKVMPPVPSERYPVIRSVQSDLDLLVSSVPELFSKISGVADRIVKLLDDQNLAAARNTMNNVSRASEELPGMMREARQLVVDLRRTAGEIGGAAQGVQAVTTGVGPDLTRTLERVRTVAENLATTSARLDRFVAENQANVTRFSDQGLGELQRLVHDSRETLQEFHQLTRSLKENPSQLVYEPKYSGVEITR
jgi:phospholipid/cholesterol/gamma-HCH transport system substrate-binding protein